jgi:tRNA threonylcarbamoyladenosine biosynthesis protein TsaB
MLALAIDTCEPRGSVAVVSEDAVLATTVHRDAEEYSSWLLPAVEKTLAAASLTMPDVNLYAVASGPGSFTGVRIGLTTVKAWAEVYGKPIAASSRLEVVARQFAGEAPYVASFINAQRGWLSRTESTAPIRPSGRAA